METPNTQQTKTIKSMREFLLGLTPLPIILLILGVWMGYFTYQINPKGNKNLEEVRELNKSVLAKIESNSITEEEKTNLIKGYIKFVKDSENLSVTTYKVFHSITIFIVVVFGIFTFVIFGLLNGLKKLDKS